MRRIVAVLAVALCAVAMVQANMFVNGDFETGTWAGWSVKPLTNGTTSVQNVVMYDIDGPGPLPESLAGQLSVGQVSFQSGFWTGIVMSQTLSLTAGQQYSFSANVSAFQNHSSYGNAEGGRFDLVVGEQILATWNCGDLDPMEKAYGSVFAQYTPAVSGDYEVGLKITRPYLPSAYLTQYVDNVVAVPEPAGLLLAALGVLALRRR